MPQASTHDQRSVLAHAQVPLHVKLRQPAHAPAIISLAVAAAARPLTALLKRKHATIYQGLSEEPPLILSLK